LHYIWAIANTTHRNYRKQNSATEWPPPCRHPRTCAQPNSSSWFVCSGRSHVLYDCSRIFTHLLFIHPSFFVWCIIYTSRLSLCLVF
jgi:hypothetical protein